LAAVITARGIMRSRIDAVKLSHHGSQGNTTRRMAQFRPAHYLISTNGQRYQHPDDQALARVIWNAKPSTPPILWFNYSVPQNERWRSVADASHSFEIRYPDRTSGIVLHLGERTDGA
jgi:hypothetical protein